MRTVSNAQTSMHPDNIEALQPRIIIPIYMLPLVSIFFLQVIREEAVAGPVEASDYDAVVAVKSTAAKGVMITYPFGTVQKNSIWALDEWSSTLHKSIPVCWENPTSENAIYREIVKAAVAATWEKVSLVRCVDWGKCHADSRGIRINIADDGPHVKALGRYLDKMPNGMVLNFQFEKWSPSCQSTREFCLKSVAVHEFGHALGFAHEQNRSDAPFECQHESQGTDGDWNVTEYDPDSIMNYCNVRWNNRGELSQRDIEAVQALYGKNN